LLIQVPSITNHYTPLCQLTAVKKIIVQRAASVLSVRNDNIIVIVSPCITL